MGVLERVDRRKAKAVAIAAPEVVLETDRLIGAIVLPLCAPSRMPAST